MILDGIGNAGRYTSLVAGFDEVFAFVGEQMKNPRPVGKYTLSDNAYVMVKQYETQACDIPRYETHRDWIDVQVMLRGREWMGWREKKPGEFNDEYDAADDISFHPGMTGQDILVEEGQFIVFFPEDAHKPGCFKDAPEEVVKLVFKVRVG